MGVTTYRGEPSVEAIADRVYADLRPASRKKAVAALLMENPHLQQLDKIGLGAILTVPDLPGLRPAPGRGAEDRAEQPDREIAGVLMQQLDAYTTILASRRVSFQDALKVQRDILASPDLRKLVASSPLAQQLADHAAGAMEADEQTVTDTHKRLVTAIRLLKTDLAGE